MLTPGDAMVYCSKCGYKNADDAEKCASCGQPLATAPGRKKEYQGSDDCFGPRREMEEECFGLPHGSMVFTVVFGLVIVMVGLLFILNDVFDLQIDVWESLWPIFIIIVGILIVVGAILGRRS